MNLTATATLSPLQLRNLLDLADENGVPYTFVRNHTEVNHTMHLVCMVDGADYAGLTIILRPDGTWTSLVDVVVGESK